jgi:hypothetical protein
MKALGVDISNAKSHTSLQTYEFAKRWTHYGIDVTGAPLRALKDPIRNLSGAVGFFSTLERNWKIEFMASRTEIAALVQCYTEDAEIKYFSTLRLYEA